jgi:hypothetical protein
MKRAVSASASPSGAKGSVRWRPRPPRGPSSRGRLQPCGSHIAGRLFGRLQHGASSLVCPCPSDSCRLLAPRGRVRLPSPKMSAPSRSGPLLLDSPRVSCAVAPIPRVVPLLEPTPAGHARSASHLLGQHLPGDTALEDKQDAGESCPVIDAWPATVKLGRLFGSSGSITSHSSSVTSLLAIPSAYPFPGFVRRI